MKATNCSGFGRRLASALLLGTTLGGFSAPLFAQDAPAAPAPATAGAQAPAVADAAAPAAAVAPAAPKTVRTLNVSGAQRLEPETVRSYIKLRVGEPYTREQLDQALKDLYETELFADVQIIDTPTGDLTIQVRESPVINRIVLEGNKRLKSDKINPEIKLAPRQIFTRSKARADVARIIELYRRQGRFAATVEPKIVSLDQNRVDVVFEINEGPKSKVRKINIIGNEKFSDGELRSEMATKESGLLKIFSSGTSYDPDRLSYDQQKLRQFYLTNGYADFKVTSAVAELTPDKRDFIITYVVEEGERYKVSEVNVESQIRDVNADALKAFVPIKPGQWFNAKLMEDTVDTLTQTTGILGFTPDIDPNPVPDHEKKTMAITFLVKDAPRVYVERIDINGNTHTKDKVIRREFRLAEGDAFNSFKVKRSRDRIQSLGFFQDKFEIEQKPGSTPDRLVLEANVEEKSTGELQVSAGFSSLEKFIINLSITERNFMGKGQIVRASVDYSTYSKSIELGFQEPSVFDKNIALGVDLFRRDYSSFNFVNNDERNTTYKQISTGFRIRTGVPLTEYWTLALRYGLSVDDITLDKFSFYSDLNGDGSTECDPLLAGRYLCDAIGTRTTSSVGYSIVYQDLNNAIRPTRGQRMVFSQDFAGLGGSVKYLKSKLEAVKYWNPFGGFIFSLSGEGGYVLPFGGVRRGSDGTPIDKVRLTDRWFLGNPEIRGFDIRGIGPRVQRFAYDEVTRVLGTDVISDDALGGRAYYLGRAELEIPLGAGARDLGLRPSIFADVGAVFGLKNPGTLDLQPGDPRLFRPILAADGRRTCITGSDTTTVVPIDAGASCAAGSQLYQAQISSPFKEKYLGDTPKPRLSVGIGVNWTSPFGPFRVDIAKALLKQPGDDTKLITFNVGTQF